MDVAIDQTRHDHQVTEVEIGATIVDGDDDALFDPDRGGPHLIPDDHPCAAQDDHGREGTCHGRAGSVPLSIHVPTRSLASGP